MSPPLTKTRRCVSKRDRRPSRSRVRDLFAYLLNQGVVTWEKITEDFYSLDEFTALRFTAAGEPPVAWRIRILPMNRPITFGMKGSN
jgi:hypothetical protein